MDLLNKHEDLSSNPQHPHQKIGWLSVLATSVLCREDMGESLALLTASLVLGSERDRDSKE